MFSLLPTSLLALILASPSLAALTTPNDLFHDIAVHAPRQPEEPVCCLRPLTPLEPVEEEDVLLSFQDWKAKRLAEVKGQETRTTSVGRPPNVAESPSKSTVDPDTSQSGGQTQGAIPVDIQENGGTPERLAPHFRIPLTDRFNYASLDCSARVHAAHKSAQSASSILSSKKDRYMLSPCAEEKQYVIVELCEDIRIDTVQLANYEFFSGVFKDFSVSVSKTYTTNPEEWTLAGTYRAKNVRGVQSFHPPPTLRDFYRFIRIDFHSHYGNEYYCPVSLLRVYGLTHLEEWQWETWEAESRAKRSVEEASPPIAVVAEPPKPLSTPEDDTSAPHIPTEDSSTAAAPGSATGSVPVTSELLDSLQYNLSTSSLTPSTIPKTAEPATGEHTPSKISGDDPKYDSARPVSDHLYNTHVSLSSSSSNAHSTASDNHSTSIFIEHSDSASASSASHHTTSSSSAAPIVSALSTILPSYVIPPPPPISTGGESIYRTIMNRLTALEANTTLYARYVEEQTAGMREVLRRLTEDIGRLEGIGKAQAQLYQRSVVELEKQTRRLENEHRELLSRVDMLTDEVVLEKRLGIAQLCLLLTVLVFMALTRGSRGEYAYPPAARGSVRDWGRRTLSFSGGLVSRLRTRSSTPPRDGGQKPAGNDVAFPSVDGQASEDHPTRVRRSVGGTSKKALARPHTPTSIRTPTHRHLVHHRAVPQSPGHLQHFGPRPAIQRSSSGSITLGFGGIGPVPKSAKRWARSAHLHEVKASGGPLSSSARRQASPSPSFKSARAAGRTAQDVFDADADGEGVGVGVGAGTHTYTQVLLVPEAMSRSETITLGKGKGRLAAAGMGMSAREPSPLRPSTTVIDLSSPDVRGRTLEGETSEGEAWVDTDVDGSECDSVVDAPVEGSRERTYVSGPAANSSL